MPEKFILPSTQIETNNCRYDYIYNPYNIDNNYQPVTPTLEDESYSQKINLATIVFNNPILKNTLFKNRYAKFLTPDLVDNIMDFDSRFDFDNKYYIPELKSFQAHEQRTIRDLSHTGIFLPINKKRAGDEYQKHADGICFTKDKWQVTELKSRHSIPFSPPTSQNNLPDKICKMCDDITSQINSTFDGLEDANKLGVIDIYSTKSMLTKEDCGAGLNRFYENGSMIPVLIRVLDVFCRDFKSKTELLFEVQCTPQISPSEKFFGSKSS